MKIVLASASPRRKEILENAHLEKKGFEIIIKEAQINEQFDKNLPIIDAVQKVAFQKANDVFQKFDKEDILVIGADTIVVIDDMVLGKPHSRMDAFNMLSRLQGRCHDVITGVAFISTNTKKTFAEITKVYFNKMTPVEINEYIDSENVYDKAGSYAIQGMASKYIEKYVGDYFNVMGFPIDRIKKEIMEVSNDKV